MASATTTLFQKNGQSAFLRNTKVTESRPFDYAYGKSKFKRLILWIYP